MLGVIHCTKMLLQPVTLDELAIKATENNDACSATLQMQRFLSEQLVRVFCNILFVHPKTSYITLFYRAGASES
jgi:hypothetical protein